MKPIRALTSSEVAIMIILHRSSNQLATAYVGESVVQLRAARNHEGVVNCCRYIIIISVIILFAYYIILILLIMNFCVISMVSNNKS